MRYDEVRIKPLKGFVNLETVNSRRRLSPPPQLATTTSMHHATTYATIHGGIDSPLRLSDPEFGKTEYRFGLVPEREYHQRRMCREKSGGKWRERDVRK